MPRVLTLNVHDPEPEDGPAIAGLLDRSGAEIIGLTECRESTFDRIGEQLGCADGVYAPAPYFGNGILTRTLPILATEAIELTPLHTWEPRSAALAEVSVGGRSLTCVVTHLDHTSERERLQQFEQLREFVDVRSSLVLGDLNTLCRADHDGARWSEIAAVRRAAGVEPLPFHLLDGLLDEGFTDAGAADPRPTSRFGVRIDYLLLGPDCSFAFEAGSYDVLPAMAEGLTDHDAPVATVVAGR